MAAPVLASKGTASKTGASSGTPADITPAYPATVANNDIFLLMAQVGTASGVFTPGAILCPSGWHPVVEGGYISSGGTARGRVAWFWRRGDGTETGTVTVSTTTACASEIGFHGQIYRITGCPTTGVPWESLQARFDGNGSTTVNWYATHVGGTERLVLAFVAQADDSPGADVPTGYTDALGIDADATGADTQLEVFQKDNTDNGDAVSVSGGESNGWATLHMAFHATVQAAFSLGVQVGSGASASSGTTVAATPNATIPVGALVFAACASDNASDSDAETSEHAVTDSQGHTWTKLKEQCRGSGAANAGVTTSLWVTKLTTALETTDSITLTLSDTRVAKAIHCYRVIGNPGRTFSLVDAQGVAGNSASPAVASGELASGSYLMVGALGYEHTVATLSTNTHSFYAPGKWSGASGHAVSNGGTTIAAVTVAIGFRLVHASIGDTWTSTVGAVDFAAVLAALADTAESAPPTELDLGAAEFALTGADMTVEFDTLLDPGPGVLDFTGWELAIVFQYALDPAVFEVTGETATINAALALELDPADLEWTGETAGIGSVVIVTMDPAGLTVTGQNLVLNTGLIDLDPMAFVLDGQTLQEEQSLQLDPALMEVSDEEPGMEIGAHVQMDLDPAAMTLTGAELNAAARYDLDSAEFPLSEDVELNAALGLALDGADLSIGGEALSVNGNLALDLDPAAVPMTGVATPINARKHLALAAGDLAWTSQAPTLGEGAGIICDAMAFHVAGQSLGVARFLDLTPGEWPTVGATGPVTEHTQLNLAKGEWPVTGVAPTVLALVPEPQIVFKAPRRRA